MISFHMLNKEEGSVFTFIIPYCHILFSYLSHNGNVVRIPSPGKKNKKQKPGIYIYTLLLRPNDKPKHNSTSGNPGEPMGYWAYL